MAIQLIFLACAVLTPITILAEAGLIATWNRWYFTRGVMVLRWGVPADHTPPTRSIDGALNNRARSPGITTWLVFTPFNDSTYGFRERILPVRPLMYTPVMRGLLILDPANGQVVVKGFLYWSLIPLTLALATSSLLPNPVAPPIFVVGLLMVVAIIYLFQALRFVGVARDAAYVWSLSATNEGPAS